MRAVPDTSSSVDPKRPARSYRELSHRLLGAASHTRGTREFVADCLSQLSAFTACDRLQLWVAHGSHQLAGWTYAPKYSQLRYDGALPVTDGIPPKAPPGHGLADGQGSLLQLPLAPDTNADGWLTLASHRPDFFTVGKRELYADVALTLGSAVAYQRAQVAQRERVKELSCLYQIARQTTTPGLSVREILEGVVAILPPAWQHSSIAAARIRLDEHEVQTPGFENAVHVLSTPIHIRDQARGHVEVAYTDPSSDMTPGPFLDEERNLIDAVAREVAQYWEHREAESERLKLRDQIRHADRLATIGQLAAGVAHELNEPLGSILGFAQLGRKAEDLPDQVDRDLSRIEAAALHSREVVRKLSLFARQTPARREPLHLTRVVQEGLFLVESRCRKEGIDLVLELADDLPEVSGDSGQLTQVLMNLVVNAVQAMPNGGTLVVATEDEGEGVCLRVSDNGGGIPPEVCARVFEPFFTTKDVGEGTGLGLSVVHGIVAAHGGRIEVRSARGKGTSFLVHLASENPHA